MSVEVKVEVLRTSEEVVVNVALKTGLFDNVILILTASLRGTLLWSDKLYIKSSK